MGTYIKTGKSKSKNSNQKENKDVIIYEGNKMLNKKEELIN